MLDNLHVILVVDIILGTVTFFHYHVLSCSLNSHVSSWFGAMLILMLNLCLFFFILFPESQTPAFL